MCRQHHRELRKMKKGTIFPTKKKGYSQETDHNEMEINGLLHREFNDIMLLTEVRITFVESENYNKEIQHVIKYQT